MKSSRVFGIGSAPRPPPARDERATLRRLPYTGPPHYRPDGLLVLRCRGRCFAYALARGPRWGNTVVGTLVRPERLSGQGHGSTSPAMPEPLSWHERSGSSR